MHGRVQNTILFDDIDDIDEDYLPASGNEDFLDSIKSVCLECGRTNGEHSPDCTAHINLDW